MFLKTLKHQAKHLHQVKIQTFSARVLIEFSLIQKKKNQ